MLGHAGVIVRRSVHATSGSLSHLTCQQLPKAVTSCCPSFAANVNHMLSSAAASRASSTLLQRSATTTIVVSRRSSSSSSSSSSSGSATSRSSQTVIGGMYSSGLVNSLDSSCGQVRRFASDADADVDIRSRVDNINDLFVEAREELELANESLGTVYFNEEMEGAQDAVKEALAAFDDLLSSVDDETRASLQRSMGMKMEQLKAELDMLVQASLE